MSGERVESAVAKFGRVPVSVLFRDGVTGDECRLYAYLTTFDFNFTGEAWPGRELAAGDLGWSLRKLDGVLASLARHGEIERVQQGRGPDGRGRPARILLRADTVDLALQDSAALPDHVDSPAKSGKCTSSRTRKEPPESSDSKSEMQRGLLDDKRPPCPIGECDGSGWVDVEGSLAARQCSHQLVNA